jgi:hypothetical protein
MGPGGRRGGLSEFQRCRPLLSKDPTPRSQRNGDGAFDPIGRSLPSALHGCRRHGYNPHGKCKMGQPPAMFSWRAKSLSPLLPPRVAVNARYPPMLSLRSHPFGTYHSTSVPQYNVRPELTHCGVVLPPGSSVVSLGPRTQNAGACHRCFTVSLQNNFIPGFSAHVPRKGPHTVRWMIR